MHAPHFQPRFNAVPKRENSQALLQEWLQQHHSENEEEVDSVSNDSFVCPNQSVSFWDFEDNKPDCGEFIKQELKTGIKKDIKPNIDNYQWPTVAQVLDEMKQLDDDDEIKLSWSTLLKQETKGADPGDEYCPFPNELYGLLFLGRYHKNLGITREIITWFIKILKTLRKNGIIKAKYKIPSDGSAIERLWEELPELPLGIFLYSVVCCVFFVVFSSLHIFFCFFFFF